MLNFKKFQLKINSFIFWILSKINIKLLVTFICFVFLGNSIYGNSESLSNLTITSQKILWLIWGLLFSFLSVIINAYAWKLLIDNIGCNINKLNIVKLFLATNIYKYLPGGIWHFVSRYNILRLELSKEKSIESILLEPILMLVAGFIFIPFRGFNITIYILCWSTTLIFLPAFRQFVVKKLKVMKAKIFTNNDNIKGIKLAQNNQNNPRTISYPYKPILVETIFVLFRFLGFLCCLNAFSIGSFVSHGELISYFSFAWITGLIIPAAPGGLGVFESVILFSLGSSHFPEAPLIASLLCYRLVSTISDMLAALVYPVKRLFKV